MFAEILDDTTGSSVDAGVKDARLKIEFVEIYDDCEGDLAMAQNCSNG